MFGYSETAIDSFILLQHRHDENISDQRYQTFLVLIHWLYSCRLFRISVIRHRTLMPITMSQLSNHRNSLQQHFNSSRTQSTGLPSVVHMSLSVGEPKGHRSIIIVIRFRCFCIFRVAECTRDEPFCGGFIGTRLTRGKPLSESKYISWTGCFAVKYAPTESGIVYWLGVIFVT